MYIILKYLCIVSSHISSQSKCDIERFTIIPLFVWLSGLVSLFLGMVASITDWSSVWETSSWMKGVIALLIHRPVWYHEIYRNHFSDCTGLFPQYNTDISSKTLDTRIVLTSRNWMFTTDHCGLPNFVQKFLIGCFLCILYQLEYYLLVNMECWFLTVDLTNLYPRVSIKTSILIVYCAKCEGENDGHEFSDECISFHVLMKIIHITS